ncbi:MAG: hypothetical protein KGN16_24240, partial [Burkholderiales bacterium]|nr:hypothetical protein [Burkholderiales bacterium]
PSLKARLAQRSLSAPGQRHIDLAVISHIDHDHIGAAGALLSDTSLGLKFDDIRFNAPPHPVAAGVAEGVALSALLGGKPVPLPWNLAWGGGPAVTSTTSALIELPFEMIASRVRALTSPRPESATGADAVPVAGGRGSMPVSRPASARCPPADDARLHLGADDDPCAVVAPACTLPCTAAPG